MEKYYLINIVKRELIQRTKISFERQSPQECLNYGLYTGVPYLDKNCVSEIAFTIRNQELCKLLGYEPVQGVLTKVFGKVK